MASTSIVKCISNNIPMIVILGSTATGKSKLGIELSKKLNGEIISADSMQVYKGLDIITNKVTAEEQQDVQHHLIDILTPPAEFSVVDFRSKAMEVINSLSLQGKIPIIVGGTNYYIESLLWNFVMDANNTESSNNVLQDRKELGSSKKVKLSSQITDELSLFERLKHIDPERASELHPNDTRKISRSIQVFENTGKKHSQLLSEQKKEIGSSRLGGPLRFSKSLVFWLTCKQEILDARISERTYSMIEKGLKEEVSKFYQTYKDTKYKLRELDSKKLTESTLCEENSSNAVDDCVVADSNKTSAEENLYEEGLFQAIGFKEFHNYFTYDGNSEETKETLLLEGLEALKRTTVKYSKKQITWIRNRFLARPFDSAPDVYELDASNLDTWNIDVFEKALKIATAFLRNDEIVEKPMERITNLIDPHKKYVCDMCNQKVIMGDTSWKQHLTSRGHRRATKKRKRENDD